jgi:uncharacterized membrane protein
VVWDGLGMMSSHIPLLSFQWLIEPEAIASKKYTSVQYHTIFTIIVCLFVPNEPFIFQNLLDLSDSQEAMRPKTTRLQCLSLA